MALPTYHISGLRTVTSLECMLNHILIRRDRPPNISTGTQPTPAGFNLMGHTYTTGTIMNPTLITEMPIAYRYSLIILFTKWTKRLFGTN